MSSSPAVRAGHEVSCPRPCAVVDNHTLCLLQMYISPQVKESDQGHVPLPDFAPPLLTTVLNQLSGPAKASSPCPFPS